jgi:hypothetical protein
MAYSNLVAVGNIVKELFKIPSTADLEINIQVSSLACQYLETRAGTENYEIYKSLFQNLTQAEYDAILAKYYADLTIPEKILMTCQRAEANYYMYHLIDKIKKVNSNDISYVRLTVGSGAVSPEKWNDIIEGKQNYLDKANTAIDNLNFDLVNGGVDGSGGMFLFVSETRDSVVVEDSEDE